MMTYAVFNYDMVRVGVIKAESTQSALQLAKAAFPVAPSVQELDEKGNPVMPRSHRESTSQSQH